MNKFTLKFSNKSLEELYYLQQQPYILSSFKRINLCLMLADSLFCIDNIIQGDSQFYQVCSILLLLVLNHVFVTCFQPRWASYALSLTNILFASLSFLFQYQLLTFRTNMDYYLIGTLIMIAHNLFLISSNFLEKFITITIVFLIKFSVSLLDSNNNKFISAIILLFTAVVIYTHYQQEQMSRNNFLLNAKEEQWGKIIEQSVQNSFLCCEFNTNTFSFELKRLNLKAKTMLEDKKLPQFLRQFSLETSKTTIEEYLYTIYQSFKHNSTTELDQKVSQNIRVEAINKQSYIIQINVFFLENIFFTLIFEDISEEKLLKAKLLNIDSLYFNCIKQGLKYYSILSNMIKEAKEKQMQLLQFYSQIESLVYCGISNKLTFLYYSNQQIKTVVKLIKVQKLINYISNQMNYYQNNFKGRMIIEIKYQQISSDLYIFNDQNLLMCCIYCLLILIRKMNQNAKIIIIKCSQNVTILIITISCFFLNEIDMKIFEKQLKSFSIHRLVAEKILQKIGPSSEIQTKINQNGTFYQYYCEEITYLIKVYKNLAQIQESLLSKNYQIE